MQRLIQKGTLLLALLGLFLGSFSQAFAQDIVMEVEPNDPCLNSQDIGEFTVPVWSKNSCSLYHNTDEIVYRPTQASAGTEPTTEQAG